MRHISFLILFTSFSLTLRANFHLDSILVSCNSQYSDSCDLKIILDGYFGNNCTLNCLNIAQATDTTYITIGYNTDPTTVVCYVYDSFFVSRVKSGLTKLVIVVGESVIVRCDSFYKVDTFYLEREFMTMSLTDPISNKSTLSITPNPASTILNVYVSSELRVHSFRVINMVGEILIEQNSTVGTPVHIAHLPKGLYFAIVETEKGRVVKRWVKE